MVAKATAHPDRRLISSEDVQGTNVYGIGDESIGEIDHLLIDKVSGRVLYAVMSGYRTGITEGQLRDAPEFSDDSWEDRDWEARTHEHYGVPGYWGAGA
jgi:hypothetical protein